MGINVVDIPASPFVEPPVPARTDPAEPGFWHGRFFPNDLRIDDATFERTGERFVLPVDYLPTSRSLRMAEDFHGPRCLETLGRWKRLWELALGEGVDAFVQRECTRIDQTTESWAARVLRQGAGSLDGRRLTEAAKHIFDVLNYREEDPLRDPAHHVLQDAVRHLTLVEEGAPFALCVDASFNGERTGLVFVPDGKGGLRLVEHRSDDKRTALKALYETSVAADPYWRLVAFRDRAGRPMAVTDGIKHLVMTLLDMARQGHPKAFVKGCDPKSGTWVVDLGPDDDTRSLKRRVLSVIGMTTSYYSTWSDRRFLVQAHTPFVREHRFLVVRHRVVASTASDRNLGVLDADPHRILGTGVAQLKVPAADEGSYDRGEADLVVDRPLLARMAWAARDLANAMRAEFGDSSMNLGRFDCYCIDIGETADCRVLPIETNSLSRCGLYAADFRRVARALARRDAAARARASRLETQKARASVNPDPTLPRRRVGSSHDILREIVQDEARWRPIEGAGPGNGGGSDGGRNLSRPVHIEGTLDIHDRSGWPLVGITRRSNVVDGMVGDGEVLAWSVETPDGRLIHGPKIHPDVRELIDDFRERPLQGNPDLVRGRIARADLVSLLDERCPDWLQGYLDEKLNDAILARLGVRLRPEVTVGSLAEMRIAAFPEEIREDCLNLATRPMRMRDGIRMLDVPLDRELALHGSDAPNLQGKVAVTLMALDTDPYGPPVPNSWAATNLPGAGDHWPLPFADARPRVHDGRLRGGLTNVWTPMETARVAMALAAHTRRVRLVTAVLEHPAIIGLAAIDARREDGSEGVDAGDLWDLCTAHVICGQVPPTRLVTEALLAGPPPALLPQVAEAVRRSHAVAKAAHETAEARMAALTAGG